MAGEGGKRGPTVRLLLLNVVNTVGCMETRFPTPGICRNALIFFFFLMNQIITFSVCFYLVGYKEPGSVSDPQKKKKRQLFHAQPRFSANLLAPLL